MSLSVLHFINPFLSSNPKEQLVHQITIESIKKAQEAGTGNLNLTLGIVEQEGNSDPLNLKAVKLPPLGRSVVDVTGFKNKKKLPLIKDIIDSALSFKADFYIFSNMDIGLMPNFYEFVSEQLTDGLHDALIINRRRIPESLINAELDDIYRVIGKPHPGFDCFVLSRSIMEKMILSTICVGIPFVGVTLAHNIFAFAERPKLFDKEHLTFHLGTDIFPKRDKELYWHNRNCFFKKITPELWDNFNLDRMPYQEKNALIRLIYWVKNPSLFTRFYLKLLFNLR